MEAPQGVGVHRPGVSGPGCRGWPWWNRASWPVFVPIHVGSWERGLPESAFLCCAEPPTAWLGGLTSQRTVRAAASAVTGR